MNLCFFAILSARYAMTSIPTTRSSGRYRTPPRTRRHVVSASEESGHTSSSSPKPLEVHAQPKIRHVAEPWTQDRSLRNAHPLSVLQRLLDDVAKFEGRHSDRYAAFVSAEGENLPKLMERCVRNEVWGLIATVQQSTHSDLCQLTADTEPLKALGGDLGYYGRAIYLHVVDFADGTTRLYVGQAWNLAARVNKQHADFRYRRDHPSLHNYAVDRSTSDTFVVLAQVREKTERPDLVLNLLEMWMALCFCTLPEETMGAWLGAVAGSGDSGKRKVFGLNVASPLDNADDQASRAAFQLLKESKDAMARDYFWDVTKRPTAVIHVAKPVIMGYRVEALFAFGIGALVLGIVLGRGFTLRR